MVTQDGELKAFDTSDFETDSRLFCEAFILTWLQRVLVRPESYGNIPVESSPFAL